jgi:ATP-binding cassette, subfamily B, bacterial RamB/AmfA
MRAQRILVMDGADTALGSHHALLTANTRYADLVGHWEDSATGKDPVTGEDSISQPITRTLGRHVTST